MNLCISINIVKVSMYITIVNKISVDTADCCHFTRIPLDE